MPMRSITGINLSLMRLAVCAMIALTVKGCNEPLGLEENVREIVDTDAIYPLQVGAEWVYRVTDRDRHGNEIQSFHQSIAVVALHILDGEHWFRMRFDNDPEQDILLAEREDGVYWQDASANGDIRLFLQFPVRIGSEYILPYFADPTDESLNTLRTALSDSENVRLADQNFVCARYRDKIIDANSGATTDLPVQDLFYCKGYGLMQSIIYSDDGLDPPFAARTTELVEIRLP